MKPLSEIDIRIIRGVHEHGIGLRCTQLVSEAAGVTRSSYYSRVKRLTLGGYLAKQGNGMATVRYITPKSLPFVLDSSLPRVRAEHELLKPDFLKILSGLQQSVPPLPLRQTLGLGANSYRDYLNQLYRLGYLDSSYTLNRNGERLLNASGLVYDFPSIANRPSPQPTQKEACPVSSFDVGTEALPPENQLLLEEAVLPPTFQIKSKPCSDGVSLIWRESLEISMPAKTPAVLLAIRLEQLPKPRSRNAYQLRDQLWCWRTQIRQLVDTFGGVICYQVPT